MPPHSNADVYVAAKEISTSLTHLRHEHRVAKRHINLIEELIDEHQTKIDVLMQLVVDGMGVTFQQPESTLSHTHTMPQSLIDQGHFTTSVSTPNPTWSTSSTSSLFEQGNVVQPQLPVADQQFIIESSSSKDIKLDTSYRLLELAHPNRDDRQPNECMPSTSTVVPDNQGNKLFNKQQQQLKLQRQTAWSKHVSRHNRSILAIAKTVSKKRVNACKAQFVSKNKNGDKSNVDLPKSDYNVEAARRRDSAGKLYYECCCGYRCSHVSDFKRHVMHKHTFEKPHKCNYCSFASVQRSKVLAHQRRRHS